VSIAAYNANGALDPHSASFMTFDGNIGGAHYIVKCHWSVPRLASKDAAPVQRKSFTQDIGTGGVTAGISTPLLPRRPYQRGRCLR